MTDASQLKPDRWLCTGCDRCAADPEADLAEMRAGGAISCCPERKLIGLYRRPNPSGDADVREAVRRLSSAAHEFDWREGDTVVVHALDLQAILALTGSASTDRALPDDVVALVRAARVVAFGPVAPDGESILALDKASEAFASRVPWEGEPFLNKDGGAG